jgi:two-component system sensor histidine kinase CiaH
MRRSLMQADGIAPPKPEIGNHQDRDGLSSMIPVFSVTLDSSGEIILVNRENVEISEDTLADAVAAVLAEGTQEGVIADLNLRYLQQATPNGTKVAFADRTNEIKSMAKLITISLLVGLGGLSAFFLISLFLANWALSPVEQAWEQQKRFVADASHELKTPLTVILANCGILLSHREDSIQQQAKWVEYIRAESERMRQLVDDLLFLAKSDDSQAQPAHMPLSFSDLVWSCLLPFEPLAFEQGLTLQSDIQPEISLSGNEGQLKQLVIILLDNACKYAGKNGCVTLRLSTQSDRAVLSVNNTGEPIPPEHLRHLFERFYRVDASRARSDGGYGLGLSIAQSITEAHKGKLNVESTLSAGTTFTLVLPLK